MLNKGVFVIEPLYKFILGRVKIIHNFTILNLQTNYVYFLKNERLLKAYPTANA